MSSLNFPASPSTGDEHTAGDTIYTYDGTKWVTGGVTPTHVKITGDTMTGDLTVPNITVPGTGVIDAMQTPKAMVNFEADGSGAVTVVTGYNIDSVTYLGTKGQYRITFTDTIPGHAIFTCSGSKALITDGATFIYTEAGGPSYWDIGTIGVTGTGALALATANFYFLVWHAV